MVWRLIDQGERVQHVVLI